MLTSTSVRVAFASQPLSTSPVWTDITSRVLLGKGVRITRGRNDEFVRAEPGSAELWLNNTGGEFTSTNAASPYFPNVRKNRLIQIRQHVTAKNWVDTASSSFETSLGSWVTGGSVPPTLVREQLHPQDGTWAMRIDWGVGGVLPLADVPVLGLQKGLTYTASAYVWVPTGSPAVLLVIAGVQLGGASTQFDTLQRITVTFVATGNEHHIQVWPNSVPSDAGRKVWVDAVQLEDGASATTYDPAGRDDYDRYTGHVNGWPVAWPGGGRYTEARITATDRFKLLSRRRDLRSFVEEEVLEESLLWAYWPLGEPDGVTSAGDVTGRSVQSLRQQQTGAGGTIAWATGVGPGTDGLGAPDFAPASSTAGKWLKATGLDPIGLGNQVSVEAWLKVDVNQRPMIELTDGGTYFFRLDTDASGKLRISAIREGVTQGTSTASGLAALTDGNTHHVAVTVNADTSALVAYVDGSSASLTWINEWNQFVKHVQVAGNTVNVYDGVIAHVAVYRKVLSSGSVTAHRDVGLAAGTWASESSGNRFLRLAGYAGLAGLATVQGTSLSNISGQAEGGKDWMTTMRDVEDTESGLFLISRSGNPVFQTRQFRYNATSAWSVAATRISPDSEFVDDDQKLVNSVGARRPDGVEQWVRNQSSYDEHGAYEKRIDGLWTTDDEAINAGQWLTQRYGDPGPRMNRLAIENINTLSNYKAILASDISSLFTVTGLPSTAPSAAPVLFVEGYTEVLGVNKHDIEINTSPNLDTVWQLDSSVYSVLGSTTRLAY